MGTENYFYLFNPKNFFIFSKFIFCETFYDCLMENIFKIKFPFKYKNSIWFVAIETTTKIFSFVFLIFIQKKKHKTESLVNFLKKILIIKQPQLQLQLQQQLQLSWIQFQSNRMNSIHFDTIHSYFTDATACAAGEWYYVLMINVRSRRNAINFLIK